MEHNARIEETSCRRYPLNCWWVVATAEEITRRPISREILQMRAVLARTEAGKIIALDDRGAQERQLI